MEPAVDVDDLAGRRRDQSDSRATQEGDRLGVGDVPSQGRPLLSHLLEGVEAGDRLAGHGPDGTGGHQVDPDAPLPEVASQVAGEAVRIELRANEKAATKDGSGGDLPTFEGHIYSNADGNFPAHFNDWETEVVTREIDRLSFVAWYRNPSRAMPNALRIAYRDDAGSWTSLQVDFLVVSRRDDGTMAVSIVDPTAIT